MEKYCSTVQQLAYRAGMERIGKTDWRREGRWQVIELKIVSNRRQRASCTTTYTQTHLHNWTHECTFTSLKVHHLKVRM